MKKEFEPACWLYPEPVLVIAAKDGEGKEDAMVAAWGGIFDTNQIGFTLDHTHKTTANIRETKAFTVSIPTAALMAATDYLGTVSGNRVEGKIEKAGLHTVPAKTVNAPVIEEYPLTFECELVQTYPIGEDFHFVGQIKKILADESILTDGRIDYRKADFLSFDPVGRTYVRLGETAGHCWQEGKKFL